ncbi:hypothetical protein [Propionivibrio sp.]|uniref:hypothetical protein n=1 Tax=Propionivibrio sp. TaxID=2212460 RepID=UPI003BF45BA6
MAHWSEPYIGQPFVLGEADCARLLCQVRREVFHLPVPDESEVERKASRLGRCAQMSDGVEEFGTPVTDPVEGDAVLMICLGRPSHIGVFCRVNGEDSVLHALENVGMVVLHRLRDLPRIQLSVEGFYRWK